MKSRKYTVLDMETFKAILKEHELKATPQRLAVHSAMMALGHASADMVSDYIASNGLDPVTVASVYNILSSLADMGVYDRRMSSGSKMYFDVNTFSHVHIYDTATGNFKDVMDDELIAMVQDHFKGRRFKGYKLDHIDIQLVCHPTRRNKKL